MSTTCVSCGTVGIRDDSDLCLDCSQSQAAEADFERTMLRPAGRKPDPRLLLGDGRTISLAAPVLLGRNPMKEEDAQAVSVSDPDMTVSKTHVRVEFHEGRAIATDLHSTNGARIITPDGTESWLVPGDPTPLPPGARLHFGSQSCGLEQPASASPAVRAAPEPADLTVVAPADAPPPAAGLISSVPLAPESPSPASLAASDGPSLVDAMPAENWGAEASAPTCPQCGAQTLPTSKFCLSCGGDLASAPQAADPVPSAPASSGAVAISSGSVTCGNCSAENRRTSKFCLSCGAPIAGRPSPDADTPGHAPVSGATGNSPSAPISLGDIQVVGQEIRTPEGNAPLSGATWSAFENLSEEEYIATSTIVWAVILSVLLCLLGLLLLLKKSRRVTGTVTISVTSGALHHTTVVQVRGQEQLNDVRGTVTRLQAASSATSN